MNCTVPILWAVFALGAYAQPLYLALGHSGAVGPGASSPDHTYAVLFRDRLRATPRWRNLTLQNFAVSGETTGSLISGGQLDRARRELTARNQDADPNNNAGIVTLDITTNDFAPVLAAGAPCAQGLQNPACPAAFSAAVRGFTENLAAICRALRTAAGPDAILILINQRNPYSGAGGPFDTPAASAMARQINAVIAMVAGDPGVNAHVADVFPLFEGNGARFTNVLRQDANENDAGHAAIAQALAGAIAP